MFNIKNMYKYAYKKKEYIFGILSYVIKRYSLIVCSCHHAHSIKSAANVFNQTRSLLGFSTICRYQFKLHVFFYKQMDFGGQG